MDSTTRADIPALLRDMLPEAGDVPADLDLYDLLREFLLQGCLLPGLRAGATSDDIVMRSFRVVETLLQSPSPSVRTAAIFQVIEPLFADEALLVAAFPLMEERTLRVAVATLDPERISPAARSALGPYL